MAPGASVSVEGWRPAGLRGGGGRGYLQLLYMPSRAPACPGTCHPAPVVTALASVGVGGRGPGLGQRRRGSRSSHCLTALRSGWPGRSGPSGCVTETEEGRGAAPAKNTLFPKVFPVV